MKEVQNSELLTILRTKSQLGQIFIEKVLKSANGEEVYISGLFFRRKDLEKCMKVLTEVKECKSISEFKKKLQEDTIPMGLLNKEEFWQEFQDVIDLLHERSI